jgi:hypothetical protein
MYALKSSEARRQYPRRLKLFFDFVWLRGTLHEQAIEFVRRLKEDITPEQDNLLRFLDFHKERVRRVRGQLAAGTVINYYWATKLFCEMNVLTITWKKIVRGLPKPKNSANDRAPTMEELPNILIEGLHHTSLYILLRLDERNLFNMTYNILT